MHPKSQNVGTETMAPGAGAEIATVAAVAWLPSA